MRILLALSGGPETVPHIVKNCLFQFFKEHFSDPGGIRTLDSDLKRIVLYPAELQDLNQILSISHRDFILKLISLYILF